MKGSGGGPQVRFRNGPADLVREWRPEAKIDRQQQRLLFVRRASIRKTLHRLRAIMWPWNNTKMLQWCGTLMARSMCVLRPLKVAVDIRYSGPRSGLVPAAPCRAIAMQVLEKGRLKSKKKTACLTGSEEDADISLDRCEAQSVASSK
ncbi:hypothetical protein CSAL01_11907 [Colletotrichum salicis]|uniref:Uncharacterized protein n=1 Tax=Colletotrichum salicis TaxID=1209931 RepID=A0A135V8J0_9PEZI|nr:hypothetical protein CSAL01_11907 [Colletotrichum salicis]